MQPFYKITIALKPYCSICNEQLQGNGSIVLPYECLCGIWEWEWRGVNDYELKLKKKGE